MSLVHIAGAGPAGSVAALAANQAGAPVRIHEKSKFPRHKVCGEFLSPEVLPVFARLGLLAGFQRLRPASIRRVVLHFGVVDKAFSLPEPAFGITRHALDDFLLSAAQNRGVELVRGIGPDEARPLIVAHGRCVTSSVQEQGARLFGFKAHFSGPCDDTVDLFFFEGGYIGVGPAGNGITNVCGLAQERILKRLNFDYDALWNSKDALRARMTPLRREMDWFSTGPLKFENRFREPPEPGVYRAGDALSFVDPFTGSGLLTGICSGELAGKFAAAGRSSEQYLRAAKALLERPFMLSGILRGALQSGWVNRLTLMIPGSALFRLTRPGALR